MVVLYESNVRINLFDINDEAEENTADNVLL